MDKTKLMNLIQEELKSQQQITFEDSYETIDTWDSLAQLQILTRIDQETSGKASAIPELAIALSVEMIWEALAENGLVNE